VALWRSKETYTETKSQDNPADKTIDGLVQGDVELLDDAWNTQCYTPHNPAAQHGKVDNAREGSSLLPLGPVEGVVDIVRGLRNKGDIAVLYIFELMLFYSSISLSVIVYRGTPSTSLTVPSSESKSLRDFNCSLPMFDKTKQQCSAERGPCSLREELESSVNEMNYCTYVHTRHSGVLLSHKKKVPKGSLCASALRGA
jgi:hypothetical protein